MDITFDYHSHILPGCDHGSDGIKTSLKQIEMAKSVGIKTICAKLPAGKTVKSNFVEQA